MFSPNFTLSQSPLDGSGKLYELIQKIGKPKQLQKGRYIIQKGTPATFLFYIRKGAFKTIVKAPRKEFVLAFTFPDDIDCCPRALLNQLPNNFDIQAVKDSEVLICSIEDLKKASSQQDYDLLVTQILNHYAGFLEDQLIEFFSMTAEQRYVKLIQQQPDHIKQLPLSLVASYLGITLERLSRIRKKLR